MQVGNGYRQYGNLVVGNFINYNLLVVGVFVKFFCFFGNINRDGRYCNYKEKVKKLGQRVGSQAD